MNGVESFDSHPPWPDPSETCFFAESHLLLKHTDNIFSLNSDFSFIFGFLLDCDFFSQVSLHRYDICCSPETLCSALDTCGPVCRCEDAGCPGTGQCLAGQRQGRTRRHCTGVEGRWEGQAAGGHRADSPAWACTSSLVPQRRDTHWLGRGRSQDRRGSVLHQDLEIWIVSIDTLT